MLATRDRGLRHTEPLVNRATPHGMAFSDRTTRAAPLISAQEGLGSLGRSDAHDTYTALYHDERSVCGVYAMTFDESHRTHSL